MKQASLLRRIGTYLLGLVDEYWAMRRPWQYGTKQPQCGLQCDGDAIHGSHQCGETQPGWVRPDAVLLTHDHHATLEPAAGRAGG